MTQVSRPDLERYEIIKRLGRGGFSIVYLAKQKTTGQLCAVKMVELDPELDEETREQSLARFEREMELIAQLGSPYIVRLFDSGVHQNAPYMVLEHIEGVPLAQLLKDHGPLPLDITTRLITQVLEALAEAHAKGIVHRDIKPGNIMVMGSGMHLQIKVLDFGIARFESATAQARKITIDGQIWGTPSYMAPELLQGDFKACLESDVYAVGLVALECLLGETVYSGEDIKQVCIRQLLEPVSIPDAFSDTPLGLVIEQACQKDIQDRFPDARAMLDALADPEGTRRHVLVLRKRRVVAEGPSTMRSTPSSLGLEEVPPPVEHTPDSPIEVEVSSSRRNVGVAVALVAMLGLALLLLWSSQNNEPPAQAATALPPEPPVEAAAPTTPPATAPPPETVSVQPSEALITKLLNEAETLREKEPERAVQIYQEVLDIEPQNTQALEGMGWSLLALKRFQGALDYFVVAIEAGVQSENVMLGLAIAYEGTERIEEALDAYRNFRNAHPESLHAERVEEKIESLEVAITTPPVEAEEPTAKESEKKKKKEDSDSGVQRPPVFPE